MKSTGARRPARPTLGAARPWITAGCATAQWKARFARRYPPPLEPPLANRAFSSFCGGLNPGRLTHPAKRNIIRSIRGSTRPMADIKSEPRPASNRNRWPASYWNARPASSESASKPPQQPKEGVLGSYIPPAFGSTWRATGRSRARRRKMIAYYTSCLRIIGASVMRARTRPAERALSRLTPRPLDWLQTSRFCRPDYLPARRHVRFRGFPLPRAIKIISPCSRFGLIMGLCAALSTP